MRHLTNASESHGERRTSNEKFQETVFGGSVLWTTCIQRKNRRRTNDRSRCFIGASSCRSGWASTPAGICVDRRLLSMGRGADMSGLTALGFVRHVQAWCGSRRDGCGSEMDGLSRQATGGSRFLRFVFVEVKLCSYPLDPSLPFASSLKPR